MAWPKEVPILSAKDICRRAYDGPNGTHCLSGWMGEVFEYEEYQEAQNVIADECKCIWISQFNDNTKNPKSKIAAVWNRAMARLGYTEGNPEAS